MIDYLTHPKFVNYDPTMLPSAQGGGGGMGTKTARVHEALKQTYPKTALITNSTQITADTVLIEPLRFTLPTKPYVKDASEDQPVEALLFGLNGFKGKKILYCSELTLIRMNHALRSQLVNACDLVTYNSQFQANIFKYVGIYPDQLLCEPIPDVFIPTVNFTDRARRIVATGNVSWQKNALQVTELFHRLDGMIERTYIGFRVALVR